MTYPPFHETPVTRLRGVGPRVAERLNRVGVESLQDLLFYLPLRYEDRTRVTPLGAVFPGLYTQVEGEVLAAEVRNGRRTSLQVLLGDDHGRLLLRFFHFSSAQRSALAVGTRLRCYGEVRRGPNELEMIHPEYQRLDDETPSPGETGLTPVYPTTEGLHQITWRKLSEQALEALERDPGRLADWLPPDLPQLRGLPSLHQALGFLHRPPADADLGALEQGMHPAQRRLAFEEILAHQIGLRRLRAHHRRAPAPVLEGPGDLRRRFLEALPFRLTAAQRRVAAEIARDLASGVPALRLIQGDVGSGKTVVAALALLQAVEAGCQAALMAPTELLAEQHLQNLRAWFEPLGVGLTWVSGRLRGRERAAALEDLAEGRARVAVGTHALFQEAVRFQALGLAVVDEQHRFGVHQRLALKEKGTEDGRVPHQLILTATPIPRSLAMTAYADLDLSVIDELPPGRTPVTTVAVPDSRREEVIARVREACTGGRQAYWVCTLIEESEVLQCQAAEDTAALLAEALAGVPVGLVHGRMAPAERERVMAAFKAGDLGLLVATTVIEVGVDVANASLMIIENPERLGLAQLHQLRGRVGRGAEHSHCLLLYHPPLSRQARQRLAILRASHDGFEIARKDLELRGPGEVLGTRQTGEVQYRVADPLRHQDLLPAARAAADHLLGTASAQAAALEARWMKGRLAYGGV